MSINANSIFFKTSGDMGWPYGIDGDIHIGNGQTINVPAGSIKDYNLLTIDVGGILNIQYKYPDIIVPAMISSSSPSGTVSSSSQVGGHEAWRIFDRNVNSSWVANAISGSVTYQFPAGQGKRCEWYKIKMPSSFYSSYGISPKTWTVQGSNNGLDWDILHSVISEYSWSNTGSEQRWFYCSSSGVYEYYKLDVTVNYGGANYVEIGEFVLYEYKIDPANISLIGAREGIICNGIIRTEGGDSVGGTVTKIISTDILAEDNILSYSIVQNNGGYGGRGGRNLGYYDSPSRSEQYFGLGGGGNGGVGGIGGVWSSGHRGGSGNTSGRDGGSDEATRGGGGFPYITLGDGQSVTCQTTGNPMKGCDGGSGGGGGGGVGNWYWAGDDNQAVGGSGGGGGFRGKHGCGLYIKTHKYITGAGIIDVSGGNGFNGGNGGSVANRLGSCWSGGGGGGGASAGGSGGKLWIYCKSSSVSVDVSGGDGGNGGSGGSGIAGGGTGEIGGSGQNGNNGTTVS